MYLEMTVVKLLNSDLKICDGHSLLASGTMSNAIAQEYTSPGDEIITAKNSHIYTKAEDMPLYAVLQSLW